jgi:hypothetical protein
MSNTKTPNGFSKCAFDDIRTGESLVDVLAKIGQPYYGYKTGTDGFETTVNQILLPRKGETLTIEEIAPNSLRDERVSLFYSTSRFNGEFTRYIVQFENGLVAQRLESIED